MVLIQEKTIDLRNKIESSHNQTYAYAEPRHKTDVGTKKIMPLMTLGKLSIGNLGPYPRTTHKEQFQEN